MESSLVASIRPPTCYVIGQHQHTTIHVTTHGTQRASENAHIHIQIRRKQVWQTLKTINKNNVSFEKALFNKYVAIDVHN